MMETGEQYSLPDLHQLMAGKPPFPAVSHGLADPFTAHHQSLVAGPQHYGMVLIGGEGEETMSAAPHLPPPLPPPPGFFGELRDVGAGGETQRRWPRQETLTLLEVRARLDSRFREAAHKASLWDEVSRIMAEEHGYQRSGRKCREKLENLYKYYKKTKEGKAGRQNGKHYRFFRQLEALYGGNNNAITNKPLFHATNSSATAANKELLQAHRLYELESLVLSNSSDIGSVSTEEDGEEDQNTIPALQSNELDMEKDTRTLKRSRNSWQSKIKEFVDIQVRRFMEVQEAWLEKMLNTLEHMEQERISREEAWRKQEAARLDHERRLWASERAWIEARDNAIMEALEKISRREMKPQFREFTSIDILDDDVNQNGMESNITHGNLSSRRWLDSEIICLKARIESKLQEEGHAKGDLWEEISAAMACLGYDPSAKRCKDKLEEINDYFMKNKECNKKLRENKWTCPYHRHLDSLDGQRSNCYEDVPQAAETVDPQPSNGTSSSNGDLGGHHDSCFRLLISEKEFVGEQ
uniref:Trihelix transcription factor PTL n=1 Tax=Elaeis guineensis var. tenera TaxID=51953 RepID=A0A6I9QK69_ELAGV|nr:trihelix transcription factor PTL [Elaeis guineensis]